MGDSRPNEAVVAVSDFQCSVCYELLVDPVVVRHVETASDCIMASGPTVLLVCTHVGAVRPRLLLPMPGGMERNTTREWWILSVSRVPLQTLRTQR
jgi:hypothetical protein